MVASVADRASQRPKTVTSQGFFPARAAISLRGRAFHPTFKEIARTDVHSNYHRTHNRPAHHEPDHNLAHQHPDHPTRTLRRQQASRNDGCREA